jgi:NAD-dependent dihydropyrimidine dehydrogenase PreA subunit
MPIQIIVQKCTGCTLCVKVCPFDAIRIMDRKAVIDFNKCTLCGACVDACKFKAVLLDKTTPAAGKIDISGYKGVWVFAEQKKGKVQSVVYELLGKARDLARDLSTDVSAVLIGDRLEEEVQELIWRGADKVYVVEKRELAHYLDEPYTNILVELIKKYKPEVVLCGATSVGRSLISRVAIKIYCGLTADCTGLDIDKGKPQSGIKFFLKVHLT